jgi:hypothetical protein
MIITQILEDHELWLKTQFQKGKQANLRNTNLQGTDLRNANLRGTDLRNANLRGTDLRNANLGDANLRGTDLRNANLGDANLWGTDLRGTDLRDANLWGTDLLDANLRGADLRGANLDFSCWPLWCGSINVKVDERLARQLMTHALKVSLEYWPGSLTQEQRDWLNECHHIKTGDVEPFS